MKQKKQERDELNGDKKTKKTGTMMKKTKINRQITKKEVKSLFCFAPQKNNTPFLEYKSKCILLLLLLFPLNFHLRRATLFTAVHLETGGVGIAVVVVLVGGGGAFCPLLL